MLDILYSYIVIEPTMVTFVIDLVVAIVLGTLIGIEREARGKDAGISTNCFVIVGRCCLRLCQPRLTRRHSHGLQPRW